MAGSSRTSTRKSASSSKKKNGSNKDERSRSTTGTGKSRKRKNGETVGQKKTTRRRVDTEDDGAEEVENVDPGKERVDRTDDREKARRRRLKDKEKNEDSEDESEQEDETPSGRHGADDDDDSNYKSTREEQDDDDEEEEEEDEDELRPREVVMEQHSQAPSELTASVATSGQYYSEPFARKMLKLDAVKNERMVNEFVVHEVFKDIKFTLGDEQEEMQMCHIAIDEGYVKIDDARVTDNAFVSEYFQSISKCVTLCRTRTVNGARDKFRKQFRNDLSRPEEERVLPENLANVLLKDTYRDYLGGDGEIIEERKEDYELYKWFVKNILFCVNYELTNLKLKDADENGHFDFISRAFTASDEAFAILIVVNYEKRWRNTVLFPQKDKAKLNSDPLYETKYTSSNKGYCKLPWASDGIKLYNELQTKIGDLQSRARTGILIETKIKKDTEKKGKKKRRRKNAEIIESRPVVCGAMEEKLRKLKRH